MWLTLFLVAAEWNPKLLFANVHFIAFVNECQRNAAIAVTHSRRLMIELMQAWKRTGNDTRVSAVDWAKWERANQPVPGQWSHAPGSSVQHWARIRISGALSRSHCMGMISSLQVCSNTRLLPQPPFLLFQNNTAFSFLAAFSTFFMQSLNSYVQLVRQEEKSTCVSDYMAWWFYVLMLEVE